MSLLDAFHSQIETLIDDYTQRISQKYHIPSPDLKKLLVSQTTTNVVERKTTEELLKMTVSEMKELCSKFGLKRPSTKTKLMNELETYYNTLESKTCSKSLPSEDTIVIKDREMISSNIDDDDSDVSFDESFILDDNENDDDLMDDS
jgi:hypothetical protein